MLAKCGYMLPPRPDGYSQVNHKWVILSVGQGSIKIIESDSAIDKWSEIAGVKKESPVKETK